MTENPRFAIPFTLANPWKFPLFGLPLRCSVPLAERLVRDPRRELALTDDAGRDCGAQWRVLSTWPDGSARFALLDYAEPEVPPRTTRRYTLARRAGRPAAAAGVRVTRTARSITVDTGRLTWSFSRTRFSLGESIRFGGHDWLRGCGTDLCITDERGFTYRASEGDCRVTLEEQGPHRVIVRVEGTHGRGSERFMDYLLRLHFTRGGAQVLMLHHIRNRHGGREGRRFQRCWLEGALNVRKPTRRILHAMHGLFTMQRALDVPERVDIDVGDRHTVLRNGESLREADAQICYSIFEKNPDKSDGDRRGLAPLVDLVEPGRGGLLIRLTAPNPNAEHPMHLGSELDRFEVDFFPAGPEVFHLGEGMGKTRDVLFNFHDDALTPMDRIHESANLAYPGVVSPGADAYRQARFGDLHHTLVPQRNRYPMLESKIDLFRMAQHGFLWPLARGWKHHGDERGARGNMQNWGIWQYINNEEDYLWCCMVDAWRLGQPIGGLDIARHLMDIDYIDFSEDPRRNGATCPHAEDHTNGEVYTSHQWCQGLLYFYLATGDEEALRISRRIGDCLVWWITGPMSYALRFSGRETAWPLLSLSALYEVTHEPRYRDAALKVVDDLIAIQKEHGQVVWEYPAGSGIYSGYMMPMAFNGIWDVWAATGEPRALQLWKDITQPVIARLEDPDNWGYVVFRNWQIKVADLTVLARWYHLTGDPKYLRLGRNGLRLILAGCPQLDSQFQGFFAMWYRHIILFLQLADEFGMIDDDHCTLVW